MPQRQRLFFRTPARCRSQSIFMHFYLQFQTDSICLPIQMRLYNISPFRFVVKRGRVQSDARLHSNRPCKCRLHPKSLHELPHKTQPPSSPPPNPSQSNEYHSNFSRRAQLFWSAYSFIAQRQPEHKAQRQKLPCFIGENVIVLSLDHCLIVTLFQDIIYCRHSHDVDNSRP